MTTIEPNDNYIKIISMAHYDRLSHNTKSAIIYDIPVDYQ